MSLYDDEVIGDFGFGSKGNVGSTTGSSDSLSSTSANLTDYGGAQSAVPKIDTQSGWNNSLKLLQFQVEAAKKRQQSNQNSLTSQKREKHVASVAPVIDLTEKKKPQLQLRKEPEFLANRYSEIRFNAITGKVEKQEAGSFFGSLNEEYDPMRPNDYEKLTFELRRLKQAQEEEARRAEREKRRRSEEERREKRRHAREKSDRQRARRRSSSGSSRSRSHSGGSDDDKPRRSDTDKDTKRNTLFAPPPSLINSDEPKISEDSNSKVSQTASTTKSVFGGLMKAEKMMAKMGYKEGEGLGKNNQGMSMSLQVEKTGVRSGRIIHEKDVPEIPTFSMVPPPAPLASLIPQKEPVGVPTEVMKNMSKCVLLRNMVGPGDVDEELEVETKEECQKYGDVNKVIIFEMPDQPPDEAVRIFVEFKTLPSAIKALTDLNGRYFGGRAVKATFYELDKFNRLQLQDPA